MAQRPHGTIADDSRALIANPRRARESYAPDFSFVPAWRTFTAKNGMVWPQYWDGDRRIGATFGVRDLPTYVLIDGEGIERPRVTGVGFQESKALGSAIDNQLKR